MKSSPSQEFNYWRSRVATLSRDAVDSSAAELEDARRNMNAARLREQAQRAIQSLPPLTDEQRIEIANILRPSVAR